jgi:hypothetical protein
VAVDAVRAALDAVAAHFDGTTGLSAAVGWPEHPEPLDLTTPFVSVTLVTVTRTPCAPHPVEPDAADGVYLVADLEISVQLDLWTSHRERRDEAAALVEAALHNDIPFRQGLHLVSTGHHDRRLSLTAEQGVNVDDSDAVTAGEWRRRWTATIVTDEVHAHTGPLQEEITLRPQQDIADPDFSIT